MDQREPGWYTDPWQDGLERRWDGTRWTADVRDVGSQGPAPLGPDAAEPYAPTGRDGADPYGPAADDPDAPEGGMGPAGRLDDPHISDAERAMAAHEGRRPGSSPTVGGMPWGRWDDDPDSRRTNSMLLRGMWGLAIGFAVLLTIWLIMTIF